MFLLFFFFSFSEFLYKLFVVFEKATVLKIKLYIFTLSNYKSFSLGVMAIIPVIKITYTLDFLSKFKEPKFLICFVLIFALVFKGPVIKESLIKLFKFKTQEQSVVVSTEKINPYDGEFLMPLALQKTRCYQTTQ